MLDHPSGSELLQVARETLLKELLPRVPDDQRYPALMVANAISIAAREAQQGGAILAQELELFARLYGDERLMNEDAQNRGRLAELNARLAQDIRAGKFDGKKGKSLRALLLQLVCARLRISNPRYLQGAGLS